MHAVQCLAPDGRAVAGAARPRPANSLDMLLDEVLEHALGYGTDLHALDLAVAEYHQRGNAPNLELAGNLLIFIDIDLGDLDLAGILVGQFVQKGIDHLARAAPFSPVIHQHRLTGIDDVLFERSVGYVRDIFGHVDFSSGIANLGIRPELGAQACASGEC